MRANAFSLLREFRGFRGLRGFRGPQVLQRAAAAISRRPVVQGLLLDGYVVRARRTLIAASFAVGLLLSLFVEIPRLVGHPVPVLVPVALAVLVLLGAIDATAGTVGTLALMSATIVLLPTSLGTAVPLVGLAGQTLALLLLTAMSPLVARRLSYAIGVAARDRPKTRNRAVAQMCSLAVGPVGQTLLGGILIAALTLLWFGGASVLLASVIPRVGLLDVGTVSGAGLAAAGGLIGAAIRHPLTDLKRVGSAVERATAESLRRAEHAAQGGGRARAAHVARASGTTLLLLLLISSLFRGAVVQFLAVGAMVVLIRLVREGVVPEPVRLLGPRATETLHRLSGAAIFFLVSLIAIAVAVGAGTEIDRIRSGYLILIGCVLLLTREARHPGAPPRASRRGASALVVSAGITLLVVSFPLAIVPPASAQQAAPIPGLIGATSSVNYSITHAYPATDFVPPGVQPENDDPVERTTSYAISVTVTDAVSFGEGWIGMEVTLSGTMAPWEGGDCTSSPFNVHVLLAESESAFDAYVDAVQQDWGSFNESSPAAAGLPFHSEAVPVSCGAFTVSGVRVVDEWARINNAETALIAAFHPRPEDVPNQVSLSKSLSTVDLTPIAAPAPAAVPPADAPTDTRTPKVPAAPQQEPSGADPTNTAPDPTTPTAPGTDAPDASDSVDTGTVDGADDSDGTVAMVTGSAPASGQVRVLPPADTPVPVPPLIALATPALIASAAGLAGVAGAAGAAGGAGLAGAAGGAAGGAGGSATGVAGGSGAPAGSSTGSSSGSGSSQSRTATQASESTQIMRRDLRPIVGLPDVDIRYFLEDDDEIDDG